MRAHSQENGCCDECAPVESPSATVDGGRLLLLHLPATVTAAATARQEETNYGHQNDVQDADGCTHQETHLVNQGLNTKRTHTQNCFLLQQEWHQYQCRDQDDRTKAGFCGLL